VTPCGCTTALSVDKRLPACLPGQKRLALQDKVSLIEITQHTSTHCNAVIVSCSEPNPGSCRLLCSSDSPDTNITRYLVA